MRALGLAARLVPLAAIILGVCASVGSAAAERAQSFAVPDTTLPASAMDFRIGPLDKLKINVFGVASLTNDYQVDQAGFLKMPLIGEIDVRGLSPSELASLLQKRFEERYIQRADVTVLMLESSSAQLTVEGTVRKPGMYPVRGELSLLQAVALAGGPDESASLDRVMVFRNIEGKRRVAVFNLKKIRRGDEADPQVFGNDIVVVDGSRTANTYKQFLRSIPLMALFVAY